MLMMIADRPMATMELLASMVQKNVSGRRFFPVFRFGKQTDVSRVETDMTDLSF